MAGCSTPADTGCFCCLACRSRSPAAPFIDTLLWVRKVQVYIFHQGSEVFCFEGAVAYCSAAGTIRAFIPSLHPTKSPQPQHLATSSPPHLLLGAFWGPLDRSC